MEPRHHTATRRREARRDVRAALGAGSDPAPGWEPALQAARALDGLVDDATGGRYTVRLRDRDTGEYVTPSAALTDERNRLREANEALAARLAELTARERAG